MCTSGEKELVRVHGYGPMTSVKKALLNPLAQREGQPWGAGGLVEVFECLAFKMKLLYDGRLLK